MYLLLCLVLLPLIAVQVAKFMAEVDNDRDEADAIEAELDEAVEKAIEQLKAF